MVLLSQVPTPNPFMLAIAKRIHRTRNLKSDPFCLACSVSCMLWPLLSDRSSVSAIGIYADTHTENQSIGGAFTG